MLAEGAISVKSAIQADKRRIEKVFISKDKKSKDFNYIKKIALEKNIPVEITSNEVLLSMVSGKSHGGICALVGERKEDEFSDGDIFYLDGIEDPFNLGYVMRTLYALGIKNVILSPRDYTNMEMQLLKSSAGAYDFLNIKITDDLSKFKDHYFYGLFRGEGSLDVFEVTFKKNALFMLGGEKRGIKKELLSMCDDFLYIPYGSSFRNALNAGGACDVVATLLFNQRKKI